MDKAKEEAEEDTRTPFERMRDFARQIIRVPKEEVREKPKPKKAPHSGRS